MPQIKLKLLNLDERQQSIVMAILQHHLPNAIIWAFGSRVDGSARIASDLDLAIIGKEKLDLQVLLNIREAFDASDLDIKVDIMKFEDLPASFQQYISQNHMEIIS